MRKQRLGAKQVDLHGREARDLALQTAPEFVERLDERFALVLAEIGKQGGDLLFEFRAVWRSLSLSFIRQFNYGRPTIRRMRLTYDQSVLLERVNERRNIRRGHAKFLFKFAHDPRAALMD